MSSIRFRILKKSVIKAYCDFRHIDFKNFPFDYDEYENVVTKLGDPVIVIKDAEDSYQSWDSVQNFHCEKEEIEPFNEFLEKNPEFLLEASYAEFFDDY